MSRKAPTVAQLREKAKSLGIKPIPKKKNELIDAIETKGVDPYTLGSLIPKKEKNLDGAGSTHSMKELRDLCMKYKYRLSFNCAGKGVTKSKLSQGLLEAGLLEGVPLPKRPRSEYEKLLEKADSELYELLKDVVPLLPDTKKIFETRRAEETRSSPFNPWLQIYNEYTSLMEGIERGTPSEALEWERVLDMVQRGKTGESIIGDMRSFVENFPLLSYVYALNNSDFLALCTQGGLDTPFIISELIKDPKKRIERPGKGKITITSTKYNIDNPLYGLPRELGHEIMNFLPFESYTNAIIAAKFFLDADETHRRIQTTYGRYTLSTAQAITKKWIKDQWVLPGSEGSFGNHNKLGLIIKAPPSWGKTVLMLAEAIDAIKRGEKVILYTTKTMVPTFIEEMEMMMGSSFPDISQHHKQDGKHDIIIPGLSVGEKRRYEHGEPCDLLLLTNSQNAREAHWNRKDNPAWSRNSPIEHYDADLVIIDEAHKGKPEYVMLDNLYRNRDCRFLLLSANDVKLFDMSSYLSEFSLNPTFAVFRMQRKTIESDIPAYTLEMRVAAENLVEAEILDGELTPDSYEKKFQDARSRWKRLLQVRDELRSLSGNVVVFSKKLPKPSTTFLKKLLKEVEEDPRSHGDIHFDLSDVERIEAAIGDYYWANTSKGVQGFTEASRTRPSVLIAGYTGAAEGLNLNTVNTVVLFDADRIGYEKFYQAVSRALRVKNRTKRVRVIAIAEKKDPRNFIKILMNSTSVDFAERYNKILDYWPGYNPKPVITRKRLNVFLDLYKTGYRLVPAEYFVLFGQSLNAWNGRRAIEQNTIEPFLKKNGLFKGANIPEIIKSISSGGGLRKTHDYGETLDYFWLKEATEMKF